LITVCPKSSATLLKNVSMDVRMNSGQFFTNDLVGIGLLLIKGNFLGLLGINGFDNDLQTAHSNPYIGPKSSELRSQQIGQFAEQALNKQHTVTFH
jgi:hypothetical protein